MPWGDRGTPSHIRQLHLPSPPRFLSPSTSKRPLSSRSQPRCKQFFSKAKFLRKVYLTTLILRHFRAWNKITDSGQRVIVRADQASSARLKAKADRLFRYICLDPVVVVVVVVQTEFGGTGDGAGGVRPWRWWRRWRRWSSLLIGHRWLVMNPPPVWQKYRRVLYIPQVLPLRYPRDGSPLPASKGYIVVLTFNSVSRFVLPQLKP